MIRALFRLLFLGIVVVVALALFAPRYLEQAGASLISALNNSAATGLAQFIPANVTDQNSHLQISIQGLDPNTKYEVTLDPGHCNGSPYQDVGLITTDANGNVTEEFTLASLDTSRIWFVDFHKGPTAGGVSAACGQLDINKDTAAQANTSTLNSSGETFTLSVNPNAATGNENANTPTTNTTHTPPKGFPNTGVNPGGKNSYNNNTYPRKF
jgi:hypothetical protein